MSGSGARLLSKAQIVSESPGWLLNEPTLHTIPCKNKKAEGNVIRHDRRHMQLTATITHTLNHMQLHNEAQVFRLLISLGIFFLLCYIGADGVLYWILHMRPLIFASLGIFATGFTFYY